MIKVLCVTGILPIAEIERKKKENDILLVTEDKIVEKYPDVKFEYVFILPYVNRLLSHVSKKWLSYYNLIKRRTYQLRNRQIKVLGVIMLPMETRFRTILYEIGYLLTKKYIHNIFLNFSPTIIHAHNSNSAAFIAKKLNRKFGVPYVVTLRGLNVVNDRITKKLISDAKNFVALSPTQQKAGDKIIENKTVMITHGLDDSYFVGSNRKHYVGPIRMVTVGRLLKLKNIDRTIKILSRINEDFIYDIFGEGPEKEQLITLIQSLSLTNKIKVHEYLDHNELSNKFLNYDVFVMISYPETFGRVYIEAMASGLPVIATRNTGIDGIIVEGKEGFLLNHDNDDEILELLTRVVKREVDLDTMRDNAIILAKTFKWDKIAKQFYHLYS